MLEIVLKQSECIYEPVLWVGALDSDCNFVVK